MKSQLKENIFIRMNVKRRIVLIFRLKTRNLRFFLCYDMRN